MKLIFPLLFFWLFTTNAFARDYKYEQSEPIDVSLGGWNKVLLIRNGNTMFFHFEPTKAIIVKVFDKDHKEIANNKLTPKILNINTLETSFLDGIEDINGEAVLFITQQVDNKQTTMRLRIDANTGKILSEDKMLQSESFQKRTITSFIKEKKSDDYYFACAGKKSGVEGTEMVIKHFNERHELIKEIPILIDQKGYDKVVLEKIMTDNESGLLVFIEMSKLIQYPDTREYTNIIGFLPKDGEKLLYKKMDISVLPTFITHNGFAHTLNLFFPPSFSQTDNGNFNSTMLIISDDFSEANAVVLFNKKINEIIKSTIDTGYTAELRINNVFTNKYGLTTIIYSGSAKPSIKKPADKEYGGYKPIISILQVSDNGEEVSANVMPLSIVSEVLDFPHSPQVFIMKKSIDELYRTSSLVYKNDYFIFQNTTDTAHAVKSTNATCYRVARKKGIEQSYLLGITQATESNWLYPSSGDFNELNAEYATVFLNRRGKDFKTKIAWVHFEP